MTIYRSLIGKYPGLPSSVMRMSEPGVDVRTAKQTQLLFDRSVDIGKVHMSGETAQYFGTSYTGAHPVAPVQTVNFTKTFATPPPVLFSVNTYFILTAQGTPGPGWEGSYPGGYAVSSTGGGKGWMDYLRVYTNRFEVHSYIHTALLANSLYSQNLRRTVAYLVLDLEG